jgi:C-terminal processing protease CtpA/Prc
VLQDRATGSGAEECIQYLESAARLTKVGENSAGCVHFGNLGLAVLPRSGLYVWMGNKYFSSIYGFIEKKGIAPDIPVRPGEDALDRSLAAIDAGALKK